MMKITFITVSAPAVKHLIAAGTSISAAYPQALDLKLYYAKADMEGKKCKEMIRDIIDSGLVFIDLMGSPPEVVKAVYQGLEKCAGNVVPYGNSAREYLRLGRFTPASMKKENGAEREMNAQAIEKMRNMAETMGKVMPGKMRDMRNYSLLMKYFKVADNENILNMLYLILREYGGAREIPKPGEPREVEDVALCDPATMTFYDSLEDYHKAFPFDEQKPVIVLLFYGHIYPTDTSGCVARIKSRLEQVANVLPIAVSGVFASNREKLAGYILRTAVKPVDLILNFMSFRLGAGPMGGDFQAGLDLLKMAGAPYLHPYFLSRRTVAEWERSVQGATTSEAMISVMLPELDGAIETYPVGAMTEPQYDSEFDIITDELELIEERVERLISRVKKHLNLRNKGNENKKVAIICYNYPPGEGNLFGGAFLDTFASVENILAILKSQGYSVNALSKEELMGIFAAGKVVNSGKYGDVPDEMIKYPDREYKKALKKLADCQEILDNWGQAPGRIMSTDNHEFLIPGTIQGHVFVGLQPSRGVHEEPEKVYHDKTLPPHHQYLAFYKWLRDEFQADAVIHVGTHGTLEFLKGKECGISGNCYPDILIGDMPHMYLYYCGNPSEAVIAKRRSYANLIGYQPPVFIPGELYGDYVRLKSLTDNYHQALALSPQTGKDILSDIMEMAVKLNMPQNLEEIETELYRMEVGLIPRGLHVFGQGFNKEEAGEYARGLLRFGRNGITSLRELLAAEKGWDIETLAAQGEYEAIREIDREADEIFAYYMENGKIKEDGHIGSQNKEKYLQTLSYGREVYEASLQNEEISGLLRTLAGQYNPAKLAGDIYRDPEILPAGYNLYQFDPRLVPTKTAYERGKRICQNTLEAYKKENGSYPRSTAVIMWGLETSRTQGETFAQILAYLGVKMAEKRNQWDPHYEIIPLAELGRPRIDVTINICGFFRDMFANLIESLNDVLMMLYELDESDEENYFKANSKQVYRKLLDEGYDENEAKELAVSRIFGPREGEYGTGITKIIETKNWEKEEQIGSVFLSALRHVYNRKMHGKKVEGLYEENLKCVEIVSQIRCNNEYEITDLDHYYEYFGGLAKSVEMVKGKKAKMYITDTAGEGVVTESVEKAIARGIRTRVLNPRWIDGMLEHKYHGVQKIAERFENVMGLAATTNSVEEWIYDDLHKCYVEDEALRQRLQENNPHAYMDILEQLMEYYNRGYWQATDEQIEKIKQVYLELEGDIEGRL